MLTITETFQAALEHAQQLQAENEDNEAKRQALRDLNASVLGENKELRDRIEGLKAALDTAVEESSNRRATLCVVTAQLGTLGQLFITCADEINKILRSLNDKGYTKPVPAPTPPEKKPDHSDLVKWVEPAEQEPDRSPPTTTEKSTIPFAKPLEGRRTHLLSETVIPTPAFLSNNGSTQRELSLKELNTMTYKERQAYVKTGMIPGHLRKASSG